MSNQHDNYFDMPDRESITGEFKPEPGIFGVRHELRGPVNVPANFRWRSNPKQWQEENGAALDAPAPADKK